MTPPSWPLVPAEVTSWVDRVDSTPLPRLGDEVSTEAEPVAETLARLHNEFERIHPFIDGNGRTGRLLLNLLLVRLGYPPVIIFKRQRESYLGALRRADEGDYRPLGEVLARAMHENLNRFIIPHLATTGDVVPLAALVTKDLSLAALRQAAQRGKLLAISDSSGIWHSTAEAVAIYKKNRGKRSGRPPQTEDE